ncbi:phosphodiesterase [Sphingomonas sp. 1P06PA]|uniref:phosphodiesterase n=1 Tax=Sphingomonas sp. 1P06PA TaxID=554121 RepID=UPI0039A594BF
MLVAQITDLHLGFDPGNPHEFNRKRLDQVIARLANLDRRPDLILATGDLVDRGDVESYAALRDALSAAGVPVYLCMGNHDVRDNFARVFPETPIADGFVQYVVDHGPLRFVVIDTLEEGRHGGAFCEQRAAWLSRTLAEDLHRPTVIVLHHPPVETGIDWMTTDPAEPWVIRLEQAMAGHANIVGMVCGHIHRPIVTGWKGWPVAVCPSTAPQVALTLSPIDPDRPDGRPMIVADSPGYALHYWNGQSLVTHFDTSDEHVVLARYDGAMQSLVQGMLDERPA